MNSFTDNKTRDKLDTSSKSLNSFSSVLYHQTLPNSSNKLMNQLLSWRKSKRGKFILKSATSYSNVCVIMKSEQSSSRIFAESQRQHNSVTECYHSHTSISPAVSFINKGEGFVSMQLMDRIMINDNELYSMGLSDHSITSANNLKSSISLSNYSNRIGLQPTNASLNMDSIDQDIEGQHWFHGSIHREIAIQMLENCTIGSFIVRYSTTKLSCYALSVRVPSDYHTTGIAHYLIVITLQKTYKIKGFNKEFKSLNSLIIHHSIMKEMLPCCLRLPTNRDNNEKSVQSSYYSIKPKYMEIKQTDCNQELLVDIDSDPNYQKILTNFRRTMSHCN